MKWLGVLSVLPIVMLSVITTCIAQTDASGCRTGGPALAGAYVRSSPFYTHFYGSLESYVSNNRQHFLAGGDSIRCAARLAKEFLGSALPLYNPSDLRRQQELNARLAAMGVSPGPPQQTASGQLFDISMQLQRLTRVLPPAAAGDFSALNTPTTELEQMQLLATQMLQMFLRDPSVAATFLGPMEPLIREAASLDHRIVSEAAAAVANAK